MSDTMIEACLASSRGPSLAPLVVLMMVLATLVVAYVIVVIERRILRERLFAYVPFKPPDPKPRGFAVIVPGDEHPGVGRSIRGGAALASGGVAGDAPIPHHR